MFGFITQFMTLFCCSLYPIFASFKAIRNRDGDEYSRWFIYWIMFSLFMSVTQVTDWLLWWLPFYEVLKFCIAVWLLPFFRGSKILYTGLVHPQLMENERQIDLFVDSISNRLLTLGKVLFSFAVQKTTEAYAAQTLSANLAALQPGAPHQQQPPPGMQYPPQEPAPPSGMQYPPQQPPPPSGMQYPPQQPAPASGMQYPGPLPGESLPPTYSALMAAPVRRGEFSDDEETGRPVPSDESVSSLRDDAPSSAPVSPHHTDTFDTSEPRLRDTHRHAERPKSEQISQQTQGPLSRQRSPQSRVTRANTEAEPADRKRSSRQPVRQNTMDTARQKKSQEK